MYFIPVDIYPKQNKYKEDTAIHLFIAHITLVTGSHCISELKLFTTNHTCS